MSDPIEQTVVQFLWFCLAGFLLDLAMGVDRNRPHWLNRLPWRPALILGCFYVLAHHWPRA